MEENNNNNNKEGQVKENDKTSKQPTYTCDTNNSFTREGAHPQA